MDDVAKYKIEFKSKDDTYTRCRISGLNMAYYKCDLHKNKLEKFGGICGLIRSEKYKGYCILCMTYHSHKSDELPKPAYIVEFSPLYNEYGQMILIEYDHDDLCTSIDRGYKDYRTNTWVDCELTFWNNGVFEDFLEK